MKKLLTALLALLLCCPALAEESAATPPAEEPTTSAATAPAEAPEAADPAALLAPFAFTLPQDVTAQVNAAETAVSFVHGNGLTRVVGMTLSRVPDPEGDHAAELARLMELFAPGAKDSMPLALSEGFHGLLATTPGALEGMGNAPIDQVTVMILWQTEERGELLILSGYDMKGETIRAWTLIDALLQSATVDGVPVVPPEESSAPTTEPPSQDE